MKKNPVVFLYCAAAVCVLFSGCSKSKTTTTQPGSINDSGAASATMSGPVTMKIKWVVGKKYAMRMELKQGMEMKLPNQPQPVKQEVNLNQDLNFSVLKELDNGGRELQLEFENETLDVMQGDRTVLSFDSANNSAQDTNNPAAPVLRAMVGARIRYFTDANGKVEKIEGVDELMHRIAASGKPQEQAMFQQMYSEDTLKQYGSFGDMIPDHPVAVGDSWSVKKDITTGVGIMAVDLKYTFNDWEQHGGRKCMRIENTGNISSKTTSTAMGALVEIQKGKISGDVWFDPELGMIVDVDNNQDMTMKITTRAQTLTQQLNQKIRFSLVDVTP